ncbi:MAG: hypothetical protein HN981_03500 [Candidatus Pacebacteria bacterium]|jgi:hypothetical protein|nr:hypothetical protein [Candidatus Paceibacterota bacterium]MBT4652244.1 hypothetical protein [Candidatus Paceibacterota bacterium]MBT6756656.1 hypothetical protein [Candidatus Paceibacterota bacterium]MBT6921428.1 hypothetical protein [Candidatus Paceibacterota bacterium]
MEEEYDLTREELITAIKQISGIGSEAHKIIKLDQKYSRTSLANLKIK